MIQESDWVLAVFLAAWAGAMDWRYRRIPNWLTVPGLLAGIAVNAFMGGWPGAKSSLLGAGLGLLILLPFVLVKALGGGDWKLIGAVGACLGPARLIAVLIGSMLLGLVETLTSTLGSSALQELGGMLLFLVVLLVLPNGLFGRGRHA